MPLTQNGVEKRGMANAAGLRREMSLLRVGRGLPVPGH